MTFTVQSNLRQVAQDIRALGKNIAFAHVVALTRTGQEVKRAEYDEMRRVFDRPTRFTLNSVFLRPATKPRPEALVFLKDDASNDALASSVATRYLAPEIDGGSRRRKRFEKRLQLDGAMPTGWFAVPGQFAKLDQDGNISRGQITQILSQLTTTKVSGYSANMSDRSRKGAVRRAGQFIALPKGRGKLLPGIYSVSTAGLGRSANGVGPVGRTAPRPIVIFVKSVTYRPRLAFFDVAERAAREHYESHLDRALAEFPGRGAVATGNRA